MNVLGIRLCLCITFTSVASTRFVVCDSCHHFFQVLMDVDANPIASSTSEAEEHLLSNLPSPKQVKYEDTIVNSNKNSCFLQDRFWSSCV